MAGRGIVTQEYVVINETYLFHWHLILSRSRKKMNIGEDPHLQAGWKHIMMKSTK
jgi:hypothetical protein